MFAPMHKNVQKDLLAVKALLATDSICVSNILNSDKGECKNGKEKKI